jgi:serine phosphatase RsbU (regulator of sigma subunit)/DNA-binding transcriptional regulator YhcF (GntR family)
MMLNLRDPSTEPLHSQISTELAKRIIDGEIPAGAELPTITAFVREHRVSRNTVRKAYDDLALQGLIRTGQRSRFLVAPLKEHTRQAAALCRGTGQQPILSAIDSFSRDLLSAMSISNLCKMLAQNIRRFTGAGDIHVFLYDVDEDRFVEASSPGADITFVVKSDDALIRALIDADAPLRDEAPGDDDSRDGSLERLSRLGAKIVLPLKEGRRLEGMATIGEPTGGGGYPGESLDLLMILGGQFANALATARTYIESVEKRRMEDELRIAQDIQANLLREGRDLQGGFDITASSTSSHTVVGDFYDYFPIGETRLGLVIADTCGKGIPAAVLISQIQTIVKSDIGNGNTIRQTMSDLDSRLGDEDPDGSLTTLFYGIIDRDRGRLEFANAGHVSPLLVRRNGEVSVLRITGPALGAAGGRDRRAESIDIREGDSILLYTDGVTQSVASNGRRYGELRLKDLLIRNRHLDPGEIIQVIKNDLCTFSPGELPDDDRTLVVVRVNSLNP